MEKEEVIKFWQKSADRNLESAREFVKSKHYDWALFIYHLSIEKLFKALIIRVTNQTPPHSHKLDYLAEIAKLAVTKEYLDWLREITTFNIDARYSEGRTELYHRATTNYTKLWASRSEDIIQWLKQELK